MQENAESPEAVAWEGLPLRQDPSRRSRRVTESNTLKGLSGQGPGGTLLAAGFPGHKDAILDRLATCYYPHAQDPPTQI